MNEMEKHIFTFGSGQPMAGHYQEIHAESPEQARDRMISLYGNKWSFQYTDQQWEESRVAGYFGNCKPLPAVYSK